MMGHVFEREIGGIRKFYVDVFNIDNGLMIPRLDGTLSGCQHSKIVRASSAGSTSSTFRAYYVKTPSRPFSSPTVETAVVLRTVRNVSNLDYRVASVGRRDGYLVLGVIDR